MDRAGDRIAYRRRQDVGHERVAVAVVVQRMVPADVAGVMFTADPMSGRRDHIVIEAAAGLGEAVVSRCRLGCTRAWCGLDSPLGADLHRGEVLVAASTKPGLDAAVPARLLLAGALVMEVGGVVPHGAVVAREYGIPAVAGIVDATTRLRTGQRLRVDGGSGTVTVLERAAGAGPPQAMVGDQSRCDASLKLS